MTADQDVFMAIADKTRREILEILAKEKELALYEIVDNFEMGRTAVSKHLSVLKAAQLVSSRKVGRETRYRLNPMPLKKVSNWLAFYDTFWRENLIKLENVLDKQSEEEE